MPALPPGQWSDYELLAIIDDRSTWVVYGRQGRILNIAMSLREALERSMGFAQSRVVVEKISRQPSDNIIVNYERTIKIKKLLAGLEVPAIKEAATAR
jgi:hypothetical protein